MVTGALAAAPAAVFTAAVAVNTSAVPCPRSDAGAIRTTPEITMVLIILDVTVIFFPLPTVNAATPTDSNPHAAAGRAGSQENMSTTRKGATLPQRAVTDNSRQ